MRARCCSPRVCASICAAVVLSVAALLGLWSLPILRQLPTGDGAGNVGQAIGHDGAFLLPLYRKPWEAVTTARHYRWENRTRVWTYMREEKGRDGDCVVTSPPLLDVGRDFDGACRARPKSHPLPPCTGHYILRSNLAVPVE